LILSRTVKVAIIIAIIAVAGIVAYVVWPTSTHRADVIVWIQVLPDEESFIRSYVNSSFNRLYPNITVEIDNVADLKTRLLAALPAGKGPDLFMFTHDWTSTFAVPGYLEPLTNMTTPDLLGQYLNVAIDACTFNNTLYALPYASETVALLYNKNMVTTPPTNMSQLKTMMQTFFNQGKFGIAYPVDPYFVSCWPHGFGGYYFNDTTLLPGLNDSRTIQGINYFLETFQPYMSQGDTGPDAQVALFTSNETAFLVEGPWEIGYLKSLNMSFGITKLPYIDEANHWPEPYTGIKVIWMTTTAFDKEKAFTFMNWFSTNTTFIKARALQLGFIPVLKSLLSDPDIEANDVVSTYAAQVALGTPIPKSLQMTFVWTPITSAINQLFLLYPNFGQSTPEVVLTAAQGQVLASLAGQ
jgi:arabinogalactan oligomer/maltooligosaccharide transport system substrate-binding protein